MAKQSYFDNGGYIGPTTAYSQLVTGPSLSDFTFINGYAPPDGTGRTCLIPSGTQVGDFCVYVDNQSLGQGSGAPSGWSLVYQANDDKNNLRIITAWKIITQADLNLGYVTSSSAELSNHYHTMVTFRPDAGILTGAAYYALSSTCTTNNPSPRTLVWSTQTARPTIGFFIGVRRSGGVVPWSVVPPGFSSYVGHQSIDVRYLTRTTGQTLTDTTADLSDGSSQGLACFYMLYTANPSPDYRIYNDGIWNLQSVTEALAV